MQVIKDLAEDIEATLDMAECNIKKAIIYKNDCPMAAKSFYTKSVALIEAIKPQHDSVVSIIENYRKESGEPPAPMMAIYNYMHERHINKAAAVKTLQDMFVK